MTDAELVRLAVDGHRPAQNELVRRWSPRVLAVCHARIGRQAIAEDLAQETLWRGLSRLKTLDQPERIGGWLRSIANHVCLDWLRTQSRREVALSHLTKDGEEIRPLDRNGQTAEVSVADDEERLRLLAEVDALPEELREPLLLFYYDEVTYDEIAKMLGVSRATVNARLAKARCQLAQRLAHLQR